MKLIDEWKQVALKAWSVRWVMLANAMAAAPEFVSGLDDYVSPRTQLRLVLFAGICTLVSRFIKQEPKRG